MATGDFSGTVTICRRGRSWSALPTADGYWTYAAAQARRTTLKVVAAAAVTAALLIAGLLEGLRSRGTHHGNLGGGGAFFVLAGFAAFPVLVGLAQWRFFVNLDKAANSSADMAITDAT
jgi:hypothetical protein